MSKAQAFAVTSLVALIAAGTLFLLNDLQPELPFPDFSGYYLAGSALNEGESPYDIGVQRRISARAGTEADVAWSRFIYPPAVAAVMRPFAMLPYLPAALLWLAFSLGALILSIYRLLHLYRWPAPIRHFVALCCLIAPAALETLLLGQSNTFLLLAVVVALSTAASGRSAISGAWATTAAALKLFPALFLLAFYRAVPRGERRAMLIGVASAGAAVVVVGLVFGGGLDTMNDWPDSIGPARRQLEVMPSNQSIHGVMLRRALGGAFPARALPDLAVTSVRLRTMFSPNAAENIARTVSLVILVAGLVAALRGRRRGARRIDAGLRLSVLIATALIVTPLVWDHYYVLLLVNALVVLRVSRPGTAAWWLLLAGGHLVVLHRYWRVLIEAGGHLALSLGLLGALACWLGSLVALNERTSGPIGPRHPRPRTVRPTTRTGDGSAPVSEIPALR